MKKLLLTVIILVACIFCLSSCGVLEKFFPCKHENTITDAAVAATCTESGLTEGSHCAKCGETVVAQKTISVLGHTEVTDVAKEPNCTDTGLTAGKHCSVCNAVTVAQETISALGHTQVIDDAVAATCTEDGLTAGAHCTVCNDVVIAQEIIPATHSWGEWVASAEGDCFFAGAETRVCSACEEEESRAVAVLAHSFVMNEETQLYYCELCDARIYAGHLYAAFDIPTHWFEAYEICDSLGGYLATITSYQEQALISSMVSKGIDESGIREWITEEGYWLGGIKNTNGWEWITGEAFEYSNWDKNEPENNSISWFIGINGYAEWHDCHYTHNGSTGLRFICEWDLDLPCDEHIFTEWEALTEATCFADGEQYRICTYCGYEEIEAISQLEHNFVFNEATGITACEHCGAGLYDGHIYLIFTESVSWFDAYSRCEELGGHLVTITSENEQTYLESYMNSKSFTSRAWIGAYSDGNKWQWITDEEFDYTNWHSGEPNCGHGIEFFGELSYENFGEWNDIPPTTQQYFICEWEVNE